LQPEMFKANGKWLMSATDQALMYELLEQGLVSNDSIAYVDEANMWYRIHPGGNLGAPERQQRALANEQLVRNKRPDYYASKS